MTRDVTFGVCEGSTGHRPADRPGGRLLSGPDPADKHGMDRAHSTVISRAGFRDLARDARARRATDRAQRLRAARQLRER